MIGEWPKPSYFNGAFYFSCFKHSSAGLTQCSLKPKHAFRCSLIIFPIFIIIQFIIFTLFYLTKIDDDNYGTRLFEINNDAF